MRSGKVQSFQSLKESNHSSLNKSCEALSATPGSADQKKTFFDLRSNPLWAVRLRPNEEEKSESFSFCN